MIRDWVWIIYPWAAHEDLVGFIEKVLTAEPASSEQILSRLKERYELSVSEVDMAEAMHDLIEMRKAEKFREKYRKK